MSTTFEAVIKFIRDYYGVVEGQIPLHEPRFIGNERKYVGEAIDSTFVSSVGKYVNQFEEKIQGYTGASFAVATASGTSALHIALMLAGVKRNELVVTQPLSFIATCNAVSYIGASPLFVDIDRNTLGLSPSRLLHFLSTQCELRENGCYHRGNGKRISACVPMHTFGHAADLTKILDVCSRFRIPVVEDAAESIGSLYKGKHTGTMGLFGIFSFNGNKTITCGGGGVIVTNDKELAVRAKHLTTQAKVPHPWNFVHDDIGYNYRLPNLNAAMACAQMEVLDKLLASKRELARRYKLFFESLGWDFFTEPKDCKSNYWLNAVLLKDRQERDDFLKYTNERGVTTRPAWHLMVDLVMFKDCISDDLHVARDVFDRLVNIPSSPKI